MRASDSSSGLRLPCTALLLACVAAASGCSREGVRFRMEPGVVRVCDTPVATRVSWDVTPLGLKYVTVETANLGEAPKVWVSGGAKGAHTSGAWAQDGYTVTLKSMNGVVLARRTMTTVPCPE